MDQTLETIADWVANVKLADFSPAVVNRARLLLLDFIGCVFAGSEIQECEQAFYLGEPGEYLVAGRRLSNASAVHALGVLGALLQYNDGYGNGGNHPSSSVLPGLLASGRPLNDLVLPMIVGYEVSNRLAEATHPELTRVGYTPTAIWGPVGSAVALCKLFDESKSCIRRAVAISLFCPPVGVFSYLQKMVSVVPQHHGWAARFGRDAVVLGRAGLDGGKDPLVGYRSLPDLLGVSLDFGSSGIRLDGESLRSVYTKREIGCRHCHPSAAIARALKKVVDQDISGIKSIDIATYKVALGFSQVPGYGLELYSCLMSIPWIFAANLIFGEVTPELLTNRAKYPEILRLAKKVRMTVSSKAETSYPTSLNSEVAVNFSDNKKPMKFIEVMSYSSESEMFAPASLFDPALDTAGLISKFTNNSSRVIAKSEVDGIVDLLS